MADEDDAVIDVLNNTAAVSHALLTTSSTTTPDTTAAGAPAEIVLAISHDERLARHEVADEAARRVDGAEADAAVDVEGDTAAPRSEPVDLRARFGCDYAVGLREWGERAVLVVGASKR